MVSKVAYPTKGRTVRWSVFASCASCTTSCFLRCTFDPVRNHNQLQAGVFEEEPRLRQCGRKMLPRTFNGHTVRAASESQAIWSDLKNLSASKIHVETRRNTERKQQEKIQKKRENTKNE